MGGRGVIEVVNYQLVALFASVLLNAYDSRTGRNRQRSKERSVQSSEDIQREDARWVFS